MPTKFKILAADKFAEEGLAFVRQQSDAELVSRPGIKEDELAQIIGEYDGVMIRSGVKITADVLTNSGSLKVIARAGVGTDNIDKDAATAKGILVMNSAEASTITTAEHAFTMMCAMSRHIGPAYRTMCEGGWDRSKFVGVQLAGKTLAIAGFGRIGRTLAERALVFGMDVIAYDPYINAPSMLDGNVKMFTRFTDLLPDADFITFHVPLNDETRGMLNAETFAKCKQGVRVINVARGGVVCEKSLLEAIESGRCGGAAIDVYAEEPPPADDPLRNHPKILTTPHLGASTKEAQQAVSHSAAAQLLAYLRGEAVQGAVNAAGFKVNLTMEEAAFVDLAARMAQLISPMITRGIASVKIELPEEVAPIAGTIERTALTGLLSDHLNQPVNVINVLQLAEQRGIKRKTVTLEGSKQGGSQITLEIKGPAGAVDDDTHEKDKTRRIVGRVYEDLRPRVVEINGYFMDMFPGGCMILIQNEDRPGMVGTIGVTLGEHEINIADMAISRRDHTALCLLKVDAVPSDADLETLRSKPGILKVAAVRLPADLG